MAGMGKFRSNKKVLLSTLGVVVLLAAAAGAGVGVRMLQGDEDKKQSPDQSQKLPEDINKAQNEAAAGDYDKALQTINDALKNEGLSEEERHGLLVQQGVTYQNQGDQQQAIKSYQQATALQETQSVYESMALAAAESGNNEQAVAFYKKAIDFIPKNNPVGAEDKKVYEDRIKALGGTL